MTERDKAVEQMRRSILSVCAQFEELFGPLRPTKEPRS